MGSKYGFNISSSLAVVLIVDKGCMQFHYHCVILWKLAPQGKCELVFVKGIPVVYTFRCYCALGSIMALRLSLFCADVKVLRISLR